MTTVLLERPKVKEPEANPSEAASVMHHWTVAALERATEAGVFDHPERLELIHGRIIENMPQSAPHTSLRRRIGRRLQGAMEPPYLVMDESPLRLALDGEPVPDVIVVSGVEEDYAQVHPTQAVTVLVVEVSNSTVAYDLGEKALLYAETRLTEEDTLSPLAAPGAVWTINTLLERGQEAQQ